MYLTLSQTGLALRTITTRSRADSGHADSDAPVDIWLHLDGPDSSAGISFSLTVEEAQALVTALDAELVGLGVVG